MKLSVFYDHILTASEQSGKSIDEILHIAHLAGIDSVDINNRTLDNDADLSSRLAKHGIRINASFEFYDWGNTEYGNDLRLREQMERAVSNGYSTILVIPGFLSDADAAELSSILDRIGITSEIPSELDSFMKNNSDITRMTEMLRHAVKLGKEKCITITLEDFDGYNAPFARAMGLLWFMKNVEGLRFTLDTGNFIYSDELMEDAYEILKDYIVHVHCKDRKAEDNCRGFKHKLGMAPAAVGKGYMPILPYAEKLISAGYKGCFAIEHYGHHDQERAIVESANALKKVQAK